VGILPTGIGEFIGIGDGLFDPWDHLPPDWALRVLPIDQIEEMGCDPKG
jgi:hypothetical protein